MTAQPSQQMLRLSMLLQLERRARSASPDELAFVMVNETFRLLPYTQAFLWGGTQQPRVLAVSGVTAPDANAPQVVQIASLCKAVHASGETGIRHFTAAENPALAADAWAALLPPVLIWAPLGRQPGAALLLGREAQLSDGEKQLLDFLMDAYAHARQAVQPPVRLADLRARLSGKRGKIAGVVAALLLIIAVLPVRQTALAPAEITPLEPDVIRAPLEGVVDRVLVKPNQDVAAGTILFNLDPRRLASQLAVAQGALQATDIELRQTRQQAVVDQKARAALPVLQGKFDQQQAEIIYLREQLERIEVRAPRAGVVVLDDPNDWIGRPVAVGEKVMLIADPARVEIEAHLAVPDAISLPVDAPMRLFLNIQPEKPLDAVLTRASYQSYQGPDGVLAYRLKARLTDDGVPPRIGLKGTAKVYGESVPFAYTLFRRPFAALRQWLGL